MIFGGAGRGVTLRRIALVRHGRSAHASGGWYDRAGIERWLRAYDDAGLAPGERPPDALRRFAANASAVATSDLRRARESAALLAGDADIIHTSGLLREIPLPIPELGRLRLPVPAWAIAIGANWMREGLRQCRTSPAHEQGRRAARWLGTLAELHGYLPVVTHGAFRRHLANALLTEGWAAASGRRSSRPWSAWEFTRRPA